MPFFRHTLFQKNNFRQTKIFCIKNVQQLLFAIIQCKFGPTPVFHSRDTPPRVEYGNQKMDYRPWVPCICQPPIYCLMHLV